VPQSEIRFVSLRDVVQQPLIRNKVICPFHDDHQPSCCAFIPIAGSAANAIPVCSRC
jgi:hypothetical protein